MTWLKHIAMAVLFCPTPLWAEDLVVFAAASLKEPLDRIVAEWPGTRVSYGGSGALARQIQQGAPADIVLLANAAWMTVLQQNEAVRTPVPFARNTLVLVGQFGALDVPLTAEGVSAALAGGRLAMGFTKSVPAGIYGQQALESLGIWPEVAPQIAEVDNVRAALALAARGEVPLAVVYASDARVAPSLAVVATFPATSHDPIVYWAAQTSGSAHPEAADFLRHLASDTAQTALSEAGFCQFKGCETP